MLLKSFVILLVSISSAFAAKVDVEYGLFHYTLQFDETRTSLKGKSLFLSVDKKKCNEKSFERFVKDVKTATQKLTDKTQIKEQVKITTSEGAFYYSRKSPQGSYFLKLPDGFKKLKIDEKLRCPAP